MIARKSMLIILTNGVNAVIGLVGLSLLAKFWGNFAPTALGIVAFAMSFLGMFAFISDLGFSRRTRKKSIRRKRSWKMHWNIHYC